MHRGSKPMSVAGALLVEPRSMTLVALAVRRKSLAPGLAKNGVGPFMFTVRLLTLLAPVGPLMKAFWVLFQPLAAARLLIITAPWGPFEKKISPGLGGLVSAE